MGNITRVRSIGKTRWGLSNYVLNCSEDELYDLCSAINNEIPGIITWSCNKCKETFSPNCEYNLDDRICRKHFSDMNQPFSG